MDVKFADFGFYNIDPTYLKYLHQIDTEVYYSETKDYSNKPFIGILFVIDDYKYFIPLTSRKQKHAKWKNVNNTYYLVYEIIARKWLKPNDVYKDVQDPNKCVKILAALDIKKMIPVPDSVYHKVDFEKEDDTKYKRLMEKEYLFCQTIQDGILERAAKIYLEQKKTGVVYKMYCNFAKLEEACDSYQKG